MGRSKGEKMVSPMSEAKKQKRVTACFISWHRSISILRVLTIDENCTRHWFRTTRIPLHPPKLMLCVWWNSLQVVNYERLSTGQRSTTDGYSQQLGRGEQPLKHCVLCLYENARLPVSRMTSDTIQLLRLEILFHLPYSIFILQDKELRLKYFANEADSLSALTDFFASKHLIVFFLFLFLRTWRKVGKNGINGVGDYFED